MKKIKANLVSNQISSSSIEAFSLFESQWFGEKTNQKITYTKQEAMYLAETNKIQIFDMKNKEISKDELIIKFEKLDKKFNIKYLVFKDLREKGLIPKTALKFGTEYRVYDKKNKSSDNHAKWILSIHTENEKLSWHNFSAKNRIANSTNKKLLIAVLDEENNVSYYESSWLKI